MWKAYSNAYAVRYHAEPVRNATVNGQLSNLVARLGAEEAPAVAAFYVRSNNARYVSAGHSVGMLVQDAEKLRTEWATGRQATVTQARQADQTQTNANAFGRSSLRPAKGNAMRSEPSVALIEAVAVTAELCGRTFSPAAAAMFTADLAVYPEAAVMSALTRCRREVRGALTVQDVVSRLDDGRPGVDEAWALLPFDEAQSVVWTDEMAAAYGVVRPLLLEGDRTAARFAFRETYTRLVGTARDAGKPPAWWPTLGHDVQGRSVVLRDAVDKGRLSLQQAESVHPMLGAPMAITTLTRLALQHTGSPA